MKVRRETKADKKYMDQALSARSDTPLKDAFRWPVALVAAAAAMFIQALSLKWHGLNLKVAVWLFVLAVFFGAVEVRGFVHKVHFSRRQRQMINTFCLCCTWTGMASIWPWWFGAKVILWPLWPLGTLVWATLLIGWRSVKSEESIARHEGRAKLTDLHNVVKEVDPALMHLYEELCLPMIEAGILPENTIIISEHVKWNSKKTRWVSKRWVFQLPRGHRGLEKELTEAKVASLLSCGPDRIRVNPVKKNHSMVVIEQLGDIWAEKPPMPTWAAGLLRIGYFEDADPMCWDMSGEGAFHVMFSGMTGSGKSNSIKLWISEWILQRRAYPVLIWLGDPTGGSELGPYFPWAARKAINAADCVLMLEALVQELERRYASMGMDPNAEDFDEDAFTRVYDGPFIICAVDEFPALMDEDAATLKYLRTIVQRGRRVRIGIGVGQQSPRAKAMGGDSKSQFPTRICHQVADATESNLGLRAGLVGKGIDASTLTDVGRAYMILPGTQTVPEVQVFMAPPPSELHLLVPRSPSPFPPAVPSDPFSTERPSSDPLKDEQAAGGTNDGTAWVPDGWDLPEVEPERPTRMDDASISMPTLDERIDECGKNARKIWDALAQDHPSGSALLKAAGVSKGESSFELLARMKKAGLIRQDDDGFWFRIED